MEGIPVVFICDNNYAMPTAVAITSMKLNKKPDTKYDINIIVSNVDKFHLEKFKELESKDCSINILEHKSKEHLKFKADGYLTTASLIRFEIPGLFIEYNKIIYLDSDIVVRGDLTELWEIEIGDCYAGAVKGIVESEAFGDGKRLGVANYFNAGILLLNLDKLREDNVCELLYSTKESNPDFKYQDQDVLNFVFNNRIKFLSARFNYEATMDNHFTKDEIRKFYNENLDDVLIYHILYLKPWDYEDLNDTEEWTEYYKKSPYSKIKLKRKYAGRQVNRLFDKVKIGKRRIIYFLGLEISYKKK